MARFVITGATGMIGSAVVRALLGRGDEVVVLTRNREHALQQLGEQVEPFLWLEPQHEPPPVKALRSATGVLHLLGEPIAQRWSEEKKREIRDSRVLSTRQLVAAVTALAPDVRPAVLVSQSATGYYGPHGDQELDEQAAPGSDFLADVTSAWEHEAANAPDDIRVVLARTGVVLAAHGGALAKMLPPFKLGVGGPVAGGRQYVSWIHLDDVVGGLLHCLDDERARGPVNVTAPVPVTNSELSHALGHALHRPAVVPVPGAAVRLLYGEMAATVLTGQRVLPRRLQELGYAFRWPAIEPALLDVLSAR